MASQGRHESKPKSRLGGEISRHGCCSFECVRGREVVKIFDITIIINHDPLMKELVNDLAAVGFIDTMKSG